MKNTKKAPVKGIKSMDRLGLTAALVSASKADDALHDERVTLLADNARQTATLAERISTARGSPTAPSIAFGSSMQSDADVHIRLELIDENPFNARRHYSPTVLNERAMSIHKDGQLHAALVMPRPDQPGRYYLIDGKYRYMSCRQLGHATIRCALRPLTDGENLEQTLYRLSYVANEESTPHTVMDNAEAWHDLLQRNVVGSDTELAAFVGRDKPTVSRMLSLMTLPLTIRQLIVSNEPNVFSFYVCVELVQIAGQSGEITALKIAQRVAEEGLGVRKLRDIKESLKDKQATTKEHSRKYPIFAGGKQGTTAIGVLSEFDKGKKIRMELNCADPRVREQLISGIKALVEDTTRALFQEESPEK